MTEPGGDAGLHPQVAALLAGPEAARSSVLDPVMLRREHDAGAPELAGLPEPVASVSEVGEPVPMRIYAPDKPRGSVVFLHGGGWVMGSLDSYDQTGRMLANASGARVVVVAYRLAPEHPYPAALQDAEAALAAARALAPGEPTAVAGDSAGGGLAAVIARRHPELRLQALAYPVLDAAMTTDSYRRYAEGFRLTAAEMAWFFARYGGDPADPDVSPLRAPDLAGLPPAAVVLASHDVLRDEGEAYVARLREAGVAASLTVYDGMVHGFLRWPAKVDAARAALDELGAALRDALAG